MISETIDHITAGCKILAGTEYTDRYNIAAKIIHKAIHNKQIRVRKQHNAIL